MVSGKEVKPGYGFLHTRWLTVHWAKHRPDFGLAEKCIIVLALKRCEKWGDMKQKAGKKEVIVVEFVCLGNICRSPMAEGIFRHLVAQAGLSERIEVRSAGTERWNVGNPPHRGTQEVLRRWGIDFSTMRASLLKRDDIGNVDYLIAMDSGNIDDIRDIAGTPFIDHLYKLMDFVPNADIADVPDPYYTGDFAQTERLVEAGARALLEAIGREHGLNV